VNVRRIALVAVTVLASALVSEPWSHGATSSAPTGLPLFQFINSGSGPLPWNATSLKGSIGGTTMLGAPHAVSGSFGGVIAYRTNRNHLATYTEAIPPSTTSTTTTSAPVTTTTNPSSPSSPWTDYTPHNNVPTPAADPIPFFDPSGNLDLLYVDVSGHLILFTPNDPVTNLWSRLHRGVAWRAFVPTDLSALTHTIAANGLASVQLSGPNGTVAFRTAQNNIEVLTLTWESGQPIPFLSGAPSTLTTGLKPTNPTPPPTTTTTVRPTTTTTVRPTTTTTKPPSTTTTTASSTSTTSSTTTTTTKPPTTTTTSPPAPLAFASDPVVLPGILASFAVITNRGDLEVFTNTGGSQNSWSTLDVTTLSGAPQLTGTLAVGSNSTTQFIVARTSVGNVEMFSSPLSSAFAGPGPPPAPAWTILNVTGAASGAPPLGGTLFVNASDSQVTIAGQAANWGDLFVLTSAIGSATWTATDVSVTAGSAARTVGGAVTGTQVGTTLTLFAAGVNSPPPQGVGVYAIPFNKWGQAITDGWPIVSETGGLGTQSAPWVGFTSTSSVANSPDFLMGQSIYNSHKRVTWLSFWTVSGPMNSEPRTATTYYNHGYAAGVWVATQIDQYRGLGVGLKPDWVIFDPEGYPDNHSGLDAPGGSSNGVIAQYATYWTQMLSGWAAGITSVDPSLNAGVYASQSEYRNYGLVTSPLPVFVALAFGSGGPIPVPGASGSNIRGFITFNASCTPTSTLKSQESTLLNPPWAGQFNTLQFNAGVYCPPA